MATVTEEKVLIVLEAKKEVELTIKKVETRTKVFILHFNETDTPIQLAKVIASEDGFVHKSQFTIGMKVTAIPTQLTVGNAEYGISWFANVDLPLAAMSSNSMLADRQNVANKLAMAKLYAANVEAEN